ncbi:hypothetical protein GOP47_0028857 [Adiantum capillus-veneris]|nr:hypothetical protein GOP47_0028857 [Adiantum capillus-veneris]
MPSRSIAERVKTLHNSPPPSTSSYISLLKSCILLEHRGLAFAKQVQAHIGHHHVPLSGSLGEHLVLALAKCGSLHNALLVSKQLPRLSVVSGTALISAYTDSGRPHDALSFFQCMQEQDIPPSSYTLVSLFKACGIIQDLHHGRLFHANAMAYGFESKGFVDNTLISMYGKCGAILDAEHMFHRSSERDLVSWNAMLSAYVDHNQAEKALQLYVQMQDDNVSPDRPTYVTTLKACALLAQESEAFCESKDLLRLTTLDIGRALHSVIYMNGFANNVYVNCGLITMYGKCGALSEVENIFSVLLHHNVVTCSVLLLVFVEQGLGEKALLLYRQMLEEGLKTDKIADVLALQACALLSQNEDFVWRKGQDVTLEVGQALHAKARKEGFELHALLVNLYGNCGRITEAFGAFCVLSHCDVATWNALLGANTACGNVIMALHLYVQMQKHGVVPNQQTLLFALQACALYAELEEVSLIGEQSAKGKALSMGKALHCDAEMRSFTSDIFICNAILKVYAKSMEFLEAEVMFSALRWRNVVSWSTMLSAYIDQCQGVTALRLYRQMQEHVAWSTDELTFVIALQACICLLENGPDRVAGVQSNNTASLEVGRSLHADACRKGFTSGAVLMTTLACMYSSCGSLIEAESMFSSLTMRVNPHWSAMLSIYVKHNKAEKALLGYRQMHIEGIRAEGIAITCAVRACIILAEEDEACSLNGYQTRVVALEIGRALHADACRQGFMSDDFVCRAIIRMYGKCGSLHEAEDVFEGLPQKTIVLWNAMLSAYVGQSLGEKVLDLFEQIIKQRGPVDEVTLGIALQGSSVVGDLDKCKRLHFDIVCAGFDRIPHVISCLFHAYGSCASMADAHDSFTQCLKADIVVWNACIAGHVREGNCVASFSLFEELCYVFAKPSEVSLLMMLSACGHAGLLVEGLDYFVSMREDHNYKPEIKHYGSLLDLLGRAGDFRRLENLLQRVPVGSGDFAIWTCLLGACCTHANIELALEVFQDAVQYIPGESSTYVLLSNVCANVGVLY